MNLKPTIGMKPSTYWHPGCHGAPYCSISRDAAARVLRTARREHRLVRGLTVHGQRYYELNQERMVEGRLFICRRPA